MYFCPSCELYFKLHLSILFGFENIQGQADFRNGLKEVSFHPYKRNKENWLSPYVFPFNVDENLCTY